METPKETKIVTDITIVEDKENNEVQEDHNLEEVVTLDEVFEEEESNTTTSHWKKNIYKSIVSSSVFLNPLFAIFLYVAIDEAIKDTRDELGLTNPFWGILFTLLNLYVSLMSGLSDVLVVNPIEEAEEMLENSDKNSLLELLTDTSSLQKNITYGFNYFNQIIGNTMFFIGGASAALSVAYVTPQPILRWSIGLPITILEHIYLYMLIKTKIDQHSYEFINIVFSNNSIFYQAITSPTKSAEVLIQVIINALNRGVTYGYIMQQLVTKFFNNSNSPLALSSIIYTAIASFYTAITSRTLNVHKQFFNPKFTEFTEEILQNTKVSPAGILLDVIMTLLRAGATSIFIYRQSPSNMPLKVLLSGYVGLMLLAQGLHVRYHNRLYQTALDAKIKQEVIDNALTQAENIESLSSSNLFDKIKEHFLVSNSIKFATTMINGGSRMANWFSFLGFLITMNNLLKANSFSKFVFYDLLCIQQLLCNPSLENEISFYQEMMADVLAYYRTKIHLEKNKPHFGWSSFWKSKNDYPKEYLRDFLSKYIELSSIDTSPNTSNINDIEIAESPVSANTNSM